MSGSANTHARLSPSSAKRWTTCTASPSFIEENADSIPEDTGSEYAREGTQAHDYAEEILNGKTKLEDIPEDFRLYVGKYVGYCRNLVIPGDKVFVESRVPLWYSPEEGGTCDFAAVSDDYVTICDLKYGQGVPVDAEDNLQLLIYALSFIRDLDGVFAFHKGTEVAMHIYQPRYRGGDPAKVWTLTLAELEQIAYEKIDPAIKAIATGEGIEFSPDEDACRWCPAKLLCPARRLDALDAIPGDPADFLALLPDLSRSEKKLPVETRLDKLLVDPDEGLLVALHASRSKLTNLLDDIEEYLTRKALEGSPAKGTKLVLGRPGNRQWADPEAADEFLKRKIPTPDRYTRKLISPTQAEELLNLENQRKSFRDKFASLVSRSDGRPTLALESDKREAIGAPVDLLADVSDL